MFHLGGLTHDVKVLFSLFENLVELSFQIGSQVTIFPHTMRILLERYFYQAIEIDFSEEANRSHEWRKVHVLDSNKHV